MIRLKKRTMSKVKLKGPHEKSKTAVKRKSVAAENLDPEDLEIARLEKLLKVNSKNDRKKHADKLNREYAMYEGINGGFGDFLMELDDLTEMVKKGNDSDRESVFAGKDDDYDENAPTEIALKPHIIDDDEQEASDMELGDQDSSGSEEEPDQREASMTDSQEAVYRPVHGEDIYGRITGGASLSGVSATYVPPARRTELLNTMDEVLRRAVNGLMNRLSDSTKDTITRSLKELFDANSLSICNSILTDCIVAVCANTTQSMTTLIPTYAAVISAIHFAVGKDVSAFIIESLVKSLMEVLSKDSKEKREVATHKYISDKKPVNYMSLLLHFYNLRILHHQLIIDITMQLLDGEGPMSELSVELLAIIIDISGFQLRVDDPYSMKDIVSRVIKRHEYGSSHTSETSTTDIFVAQDSRQRVNFMLEAVADLKTNKARRTANTHKDTAIALRKWLGTIKSSLKSKMGGISFSQQASGSASLDSSLHVSLKDLMDADKAGRWWRAGASWAGNNRARDGKECTNLLDESLSSVGRKNGVKAGGKNLGLAESCYSNSSVSVASKDEAILLKLAKKLRFNTESRRSIFVVAMSSRDVIDAFERIQRLELKGKADREIVRVLCECCAQEKTYNAFYEELISLFCQSNKQFKTTTQFAFYDFFKAVEGASVDNVLRRRVVNMARLLAHLVASFEVPLAVLKRVDMADLSEVLVLFLATFFIALFTAQIPEETFQSVLDRVATTKDFAAVRDSVLYFLQRHFTKVPTGLADSDSKMILTRRKVAIRTMEAMTVLDVARGFDDTVGRH